MEECENIRPGDLFYDVQLPQGHRGLYSLILSCESSNIAPGVTILCALSPISGTRFYCSIESSQIRYSILKWNLHDD